MYYPEPSCLHLTFGPRGQTLHYLPSWHSSSGKRCACKNAVEYQTLLLLCRFILKGNLTKLPASFRLSPSGFTHVSGAWLNSVGLGVAARRRIHVSSTAGLMLAWGRVSSGWRGVLNWWRSISALSSTLFIFNFHFFYFEKESTDLQRINNNVAHIKMRINSKLERRKNTTQSN